MPQLEYDLGGASALAAVVWQAARDVGAVLLVETPGAEDGEPGLLGRSQALLNVCLVLTRGGGVSSCPGQRGNVRIYEPH